MPTPKIFTDEELRQRKNARSKQRYKENREKILEYHAELYQKKKVSDPEFLKKMAEKSAAYRARNPDFTSLQNAKRKAKDPEAERARCRLWFAKNPGKRSVYEQNRRARKKQALGVLSPDIKEKLMILQKGKCACCKCQLKCVVAHLDHIDPLSKGGGHDDKNMQLLCQACNNRKYNKDSLIFMQKNGYLL